MPIDYSRYPADWKAISRRIRFERAGGKCEWCGAPNGLYVIRRDDGTFKTWTNCEQDRDTRGVFWLAWQEEDGEICSDYDTFRGNDRPIKIVLTVAHLDHDTTNNDDSNLAALCQRDHLRHDAQHHAKNAAQTRRRRKVEAGQGEFPLCD
jgi:hypothetical protein